MIRSIAVAVVMLAACGRASLDDDTFRKASAAIAKFARWPLATLQALAVSAVIALRCG